MCKDKDWESSDIKSKSYMLKRAIKGIINIKVSLGSVDADR